MSQTLLRRASRIEQSRRFRDAILEVLADGEAHPINAVLETVAERCGSIAAEVIPTLTSAAAAKHIQIDYVLSTVRTLR